MYHSVDSSRARVSGARPAISAGRAPRSTSLRWASTAATFRSSHGPTSTAAPIHASGTLNTARREPITSANSATAACGCVARYRALGCQGAPASGQNCSSPAACAASIVTRWVCTWSG